MGMVLYAFKSINMLLQRWVVCHFDGIEPRLRRRRKCIASACVLPYNPHI